jgi:hypothetical protein
LCRAPTSLSAQRSQIQATGGATDNQVAISPDPKNGVAFTILSSSVTNGITTTTLALVPNQTLPSPANLILDGNQQGNSNYAAATQATITIPVLSRAAAADHHLGQSGNAGCRRHLDAQRDGEFRVRGHVRFRHNVGLHGQWFEGHVCECDLRQRLHHHGFTAWRQQNLCRGSAVDADIRSQPAGQSPNLNMNLSLSSLTIQPGTVGLTQITLTSVNNFAASSIAFSCSGLPTGYTCAFNPNPVTVFAQSATTGMPLGTTVTTTLTITPPATAAVVRQDFRPLFPATLAVALCFLGFKKRNRLYMLVLLVALSCCWLPVTLCRLGRRLRLRWHIVQFDAIPLPVREWILEQNGKSRPATGQLFLRENSSNGGKTIRTFWLHSRGGGRECQGEIEAKYKLFIFNIYKSIIGED